MNERYEVRVSGQPGKYVVVDTKTSTLAAEATTEARARRIARDLNKSHARGEQG